MTLQEIKDKITYVNKEYEKGNLDLALKELQVLLDIEGNFPLEEYEYQEVYIDIHFAECRIIQMKGQLYESLEKSQSLYEITQKWNFEEKSAYVINFIGIIEDDLSKFDEAMHSYTTSLEIFEKIQHKKGIGLVLSNIANVYHGLSDSEKALEYHAKALLSYQEIGESRGMANVYNNTGLVFKELQQDSKALEYYLKALEIYKEFGFKYGMAVSIGNIGVVYSSMNRLNEALTYYNESLMIQKEISNLVGISRAQINIGNVYIRLKNYSKALEFYNEALHHKINSKEIDGQAIVLLNIGSIYSEKEFENYDSETAIEYFKKSLELFESIGSKIGKKNVHHSLSEVYKELESFEKAYEHLNISMELDKQILKEDSAHKAQMFDLRRKIEEDEKARQLKLARFQEQEKLLHNILPVNIADRILQQENFIADHFESVSVLFMDLVGFTPLSSIAPPKQLVYILDTIFQKADEVVERFGLEKIKTIGDGYLAVANVTKSLENHQNATALAALELLKTMKEFNVTISSDLGNTDWTKDMKEIQVRIGIHTGEVVAGVISKKKMTFDLWGDAVNVASRMESNSIPWKIHISHQFAKAIESNPMFKLIPRGEINIKGKGTMNTFWLEKGE